MTDITHHQFSMISSIVGQEYQVTNFDSCLIITPNKFDEQVITELVNYLRAENLMIDFRKLVAVVVANE